MNSAAGILEAGEVSSNHRLAEILSIPEDLDLTSVPLGPRTIVDTWRAQLDILRADIEESLRDLKPRLANFEKLEGEIAKLQACIESLESGQLDHFGGELRADWERLLARQNQVTEAQLQRFLSSRLIINLDDRFARQSVLAEELTNGLLIALKSLEDKAVKYQRDSKELSDLNDHQRACDEKKDFSRSALSGWGNYLNEIVRFIESFSSNLGAQTPDTLISEVRNAWQKERQKHLEELRQGISGQLIGCLVCLHQLDSQRVELNAFTDALLTELSLVPGGLEAPALTARYKNFLKALSSGSSVRGVSEKLTEVCALLDPALTDYGARLLTDQSLAIEVSGYLVKKFELSNSIAAGLAVNFERTDFESLQGRLSNLNGSEVLVAAVVQRNPHLLSLSVEEFNEYFSGLNLLAGRSEIARQHILVFPEQYCSLDLVARRLESLDCSRPDVETRQIEFREIIEIATQRLREYFPRKLGELELLATILCFALDREGRTISEQKQAVIDLELPIGDGDAENLISKRRLIALKDTGLLLKSRNSYFLDERSLRANYPLLFEALQLARLIFLPEQVVEREGELIAQSQVADNRTATKVENGKKEEGALEALTDLFSRWEKFCDSIGKFEKEHKKLCLAIDRFEGLKARYEGEPWWRVLARTPNNLSEAGFYTKVVFNVSCFFMRPIAFYYGVKFPSIEGHFNSSLRGSSSQVDRLADSLAPQIGSLQGLITDSLFMLVKPQVSAMFTGAQLDVLRKQMRELSFHWPRSGKVTPKDLRSKTSRIVAAITKEQGSPEETALDRIMKSLRLIVDEQKRGEV